MTTKTPAFQFYPNDWLGSTAIMLMTPAQEGAYIRLLSIAWNDPDCSLPNDDEQLAVLSRLGEGWFNGGSSLVRKCFIESALDSSRLVNLRLLRERQKQAEWSRKSHNGGVKSGEARRKKSGRVLEGWLKGGCNLVEPKGNSSSSSSSSISSSLRKKIQRNPLPLLTGTCLDTDQFKLTWQNWMQYQTEKRRRLPQSTINKQLKKLEAMGHDDAIAAIDQSILHNWTGLFSPRNSSDGGRQPAADRRRDEERGRQMPEPARELPRLL